MIVKRFKREDLDAIPVQDRQRFALPFVTDAALEQMEQGPAYTLHDDGPVACAGIVSGDVPVAWAWLSEDVPMLALHRYVRAALQAVPYCIAYGALDWPQALRWLELLGFTPTGEVEELGGIPHGMFERYG